MSEEKKAEVKEIKAMPKRDTEAKAVTEAQEHPDTAKLREARKELTKLRKELRGANETLELTTKQNQEYFQRFKASSEELIELKRTMAGSLDIIGDALNISLKQLTAAFKPLQNK